jgi:hypothetical protein
MEISNLTQETNHQKTKDKNDTTKESSAYHRIYNHLLEQKDYTVVAYNL